MDEKTRFSIENRRINRLFALIAQLLLKLEENNLLTKEEIEEIKNKAEEATKGSIDYPS